MTLQKNSVSILGKVEVAVRKRRAGESETRAETSGCQSWNQECERYETSAES